MDFHVKRGNRTDISVMTDNKKDNTMKTDNGKDVSMKTDNGKDVTAMTDNRKDVTIMSDSRKDVTIMTDKKDVTMMTDNGTGISRWQTIMKTQAKLDITQKNDNRTANCLVIQLIMKTESQRSQGNKPYIRRMAITAIPATWSSSGIM
ncbi:hypothetical protein ACOMHN_020312 [Nucella lapillus]